VLAKAVSFPMWADSSGPFFLLERFWIVDRLMSWQSAVERTVVGMGYELVDAEKGAGGLLRVYIDHSVDHSVDQSVGQSDGHAEAAQPAITVDDCEKVTRQLQHVLEVEGCSYERLEVSSPGLDRPLRKAADYLRFAGEQVEVTLKEPFKGRKKYRGELRALEGEGAFRLVLPSERASAKPGAKVSAKRAAAPSAGADAADAERALDFSLDEVREARLVPVLDFKGRRFAAPEAAAGSNNEVEGGRIR
jgi:ribosome maturation factor RimP